MDNIKLVNDKIIDLYQKSGLTVSEIISSLKHLLATAKISQERVKLKGTDNE